MAPFTSRQLRELDMHDAQTLEPPNMVTKGFGHPPNLPIATFDKDDLQRIGRDPLDTAWQRRSALIADVDAGCKASDFLVGDGLAQGDEVLAFMSVFRREQRLHDIPLICQ